MRVVGVHARQPGEPEVVLRRCCVAVPRLEQADNEFAEVRPVASSASKKYSAPHPGIAAAALGQSFRKSAAICLRALARPGRRAHRSPGPRWSTFYRRLNTCLGGLRRKTRAGSWFRTARIGDPALSVSVGHNSDFSICTGDGTQAPRPADRRTCSGARGVALVLVFPSQSACGCSESASLCKGHWAHNRHQRAVVYAVLSQAVLSEPCQYDARPLRRYNRRRHDGNRSDVTDEASRTADRNADICPGKKRTAKWSKAYRAVSPATRMYVIRSMRIR